MDRDDTAPASAEDIQALIESLSQLRLSLSTDLSAAAGALDADRPDIAADLVAGTRVDVAHLRHSVLRREQAADQQAGQEQAAQELVSVGAGDRTAGSAGDGGDAPPRGTAGSGASRSRVPTPLRHPGRILAGVAALAAMLLLAPHLDGGSGSGGSAAGAASSESPQIRLVSVEFQALQTTLRSPDPTPAAILAAGQKWQQAVTQSLSVASTQVTTATQLVLLLRQERTLISDAGLQTPALSAATQTLAGGSDTLLNQLRGMANGQVLASLPTAIVALPTAPSGTTTVPATTPSTGGSTGGTTPTPTPTSGGTATPAPEPTTSAPSTPAGSATPTTKPSGPTPPDQSSPAPTQQPSSATPTPTATATVPGSVIPQLQIPSTLASAGAAAATAAPAAATGGSTTGG